MNTELLRKPQHKLILSILLSVFLVALTVFVIVSTQNKVKEGRYIGLDVESKNTITVSGSGEVYAKPDLAITSFTVVTEASTVSEAMSENTSKMNDIIKELKALDIDKEDLKTTNFNIYPRYEYRSGESYIIPVEGTRVLAGYEVTQTLQVKIRDLDIIGEVIQTATASGANQVGSLQFTIDDQDALKEQAREEAIEDAKGKAKAIAGQLNIKLVRIVNFQEGGTVPRLYYDSYSLKEAAGMGGGDEEMQIETGENKIEVQVDITYEIN